MSAIEPDASPRLSLRGSSPPGQFWSELRESFRHPDFWALSSWLDIIVKARRSRLGVIWLVAPAVVYVFGLGSFFVSMRGISGDSVGAYYLHIALGALVFRSLMSTIIGGANVFTSSGAFILDGHVRLTDYVLQSLARSFFDLCTYLPVAMVAIWLAGGVELSGLWISIPVFILLYINALWIATVFALAGARHPDLSQLLGTVSIFLFLLTPIIWYQEMMPEGSMRGALMRFNPFFHFVELIRAPLMGKPIDPNSFVYIGVMSALGLSFATWAYRRYARFVPLWI